MHLEHKPIPAETTIHKSPGHQDDKCGLAWWYERNFSDKCSRATFMCLETTSEIHIRDAPTASFLIFDQIGYGIYKTCLQTGKCALASYKQLT